MEDPPGLIQVRIRNPEKQCDGFDEYVDSNLWDYPLHAQTASEHASKKASIDPKLMTSLYKLPPDFTSL